MPDGHAAGISFPRTAAEVAALVASASRVLPIGAQSSLTGGATPRGDVVISTRALNEITRISGTVVHAGAGVPLTQLQHVAGAEGLYYPPVPTFEGAFLGGTIATNAAGAATFKYGSTRGWVESLTVVLADGHLLELRRGDVVASADAEFELVLPTGASVRVPVPTYRMPNLSKLSAGYYAASGMDLIDLFIGSEGTLGVIVDASVRVIPRPRRALAVVTSASDDQAVSMTAALRNEAAASWRGEGALDVSAIEYIDPRALDYVDDGAFSRSGVRRPAPGHGLVMLQIELPADDSTALERLSATLESCGVREDPYLVAAGDERGAVKVFELREAVPAAVNARIGAVKARVHPDIQKTAGDFIVPMERVADSIALYRRTFERHGLQYAIWGHLSDGNLHPNVIPESLDEYERGREALLEAAQGVIAMGGAPLAEHGVGRNPMKQRLLRELYGDEGIAQMCAVKRALDPGWKLAPGVLFPEPR